MDIRLPDGRILKNVPEGTTKEQIMAKLSGAGIPAPDSFDAMEMVKNIPSSAVNYGLDIAQAVTSPVQTAKGIGSVIEAGANKLGRTLAEQTNMRCTAVQTESGVPQMRCEPSQIEEMPERSEAPANALWDAAVSRYGSIEAAKQTLQNDPVGALADLSGVMMATKVPGVARVGASIEPVNMVGSAVKGAAKAAVPAGYPSKLYQSAAKFSTTIKPPDRERMVNTALEGGYMPTSAGVTKLGDRINTLNTEVDRLISEATETGSRIPVEAVMVHLKKLRREKGGPRIEASEDLSAIDSYAKQFIKNMRGRKSLTPQQLQEFKVDAYNKIAWDANRMAGAPIKEDTYKALARGAKDAIVSRIPAVDVANRELGSLYDLEPNLLRSAKRIDNRNLVSIDTPLKVTGGAVAGQTVGGAGIGAAIGTVASVLGNPKIKARIAIALDKIKKGDRVWLRKNLTPAQIRVALALAGRSEAELRGLGLSPSQ